MNERQEIAASTEVVSSHYQMQAAKLIGSIASEKVLNSRELKTYSLELERKFVAPTHAVPSQLVLVLKNTRLCNLRCTYCRSWAEGPGHLLGFEVLARIIKEALSIPNIRLVEFVWHGGEVTQLSPKYFTKLIWLQQKFKQPETIVKNNLQTNAVSLSEEWYTFLRGHRLDIGISLDGPPQLNDQRRIDKLGDGTSDRIVSTIKKLQTLDVNHGALMVVDREVAAFPIEEMLDYVASLKLDGLSLLNVLPENSEDTESEYFSVSEYVDYLIEFYKIWSEGYRDQVSIQPLENLEKGVRNSTGASSCLWSGSCMGKFVTVEANGDVAPCDKYVGADNAIIGNIMQHSLHELLRSLATDSEFVLHAKGEAAETQKCRWHHVCRGGCPHDRFISDKIGLTKPSGCCGFSKLLDIIETTGVQTQLT